MAGSTICTQFEAGPFTFKGEYAKFIGADLIDSQPSKLPNSFSVHYFSHQNKNPGAFPPERFDHCLQTS